MAAVACDLAKKFGDHRKLAAFEKRTHELKQVLLEKEDSFFNGSILSQAEKRWLKDARPEHAKEWHVLTDLSAEHLSHVS
jgi:hypothetical protein